MFLFIFASFNSQTMHQTLLLLHSVNRYLVVFSLIAAIITAWNGIRLNKPFSRSSNTIRHLTATITHIQLVLGIALYCISPVVKLAGFDAASDNIVSEHTFFRFIHLCLMIIAIVIITIGSATAKRMDTDQSKFRNMLRWYSLGLLIILIAIPWPFSPLANRPFLRSF
ncbi:hypothetical protein [Chitinophaga agri]|nr:hypothetical protein [Chitinophaga agri]